MPLCLELWRNLFGWVNPIQLRISFKESYLTRFSWTIQLRISFKEILIDWFDWRFSNQLELRIDSDFLFVWQLYSRNIIQLVRLESSNHHELWITWGSFSPVIKGFNSTGLSGVLKSTGTSNHLIEDFDCRFYKIEQEAVLASTGFVLRQRSSISFLFDQAVTIAVFDLLSSSSSGLFGSCGSRPFGSSGNQYYSITVIHIIRLSHWYSIRASNQWVLYSLRVVSNFCIQWPKKVEQLVVLRMVAVLSTIPISMGRMELQEVLD